MAAPLLTALLAVVGAWIAIHFDRRKSINQELIKKRIAVYDDMVPKINDLLCYFMCVGNWKSLFPETMLDHKRMLDRSIHVYGALFSKELTVRNQRFINSCFETYTGRGQPAKLRASLERLKGQWGVDWRPAWESAFAQESKVVTDDELQAHYQGLLKQFAVEIGAASE